MYLKCLIINEIDLDNGTVYFSTYKKDALEKEEPVTKKEPIIKKILTIRKLKLIIITVIAIHILKKWNFLEC